jgi:hemerythrin
MREWLQAHIDAADKRISMLRNLSIEEYREEKARAAV